MDYHSCIIENLTAFAVIYHIPLAAGKEQRPGLGVPPSLGWCGTTEIMAFEHMVGKKTQYQNYKEKVISKLHCNKLTNLLGTY